MKVRLETGTDLYLTRVGRISGGIGRIGPVPGLQSSLADTVSYHESQNCEIFFGQNHVLN